MPRRFRKCLHLLGCVAFAVGWLVSLQVQAAENSVTGLRLGSVDIDGTAALRVVVETSSNARAKLTLLSDPYRFVVDMPDTDWQVDGIAKRGTLARAPATAYRFGTPDPQTGRVVIELDAPAAPLRRFTLPAADGRGHRLIFDLVDRGPTAFRLAAKALAREGLRDYAAGAAPASPAASPAASTAPSSAPSSASAGAVATPRPEAKPPRPVVQPAKPARKTQAPAATGTWKVFIDAGHGGKDPGAIGRSKTLEKEITLAASLELADQLRATGLITPILSRTDDRYLKLRQRIQLARDQSADIFISLHADAAPSAKARGISVFTLSDTASDKEAALLAKTENQADLIGGPDLSVEDPDAAANAHR